MGYTKYTNFSILTYGELRELDDNINNIHSINDIQRILDCSKEKAILITVTSHLRDHIDDNLNEYEKSLKDNNDVTDINNVEIIGIYEDDHECNTQITFYDQDGKLRFVTIGYDNFAPGMVRYYNLHDKIKQDLIKKININMEYASEEVDA